jgi:hypothetical protein
MRGTNLFPIKIYTMRIGKRDSTLSTSLQRKPLQLEDGNVSSIEGFSELLQVIVRNLCLLLGPQPDEHPRKNVVHQLKDLLDRYPVCFEYVNHGHKRIIAWLQSRQRHLDTLCTTKGTEKQQERKISGKVQGSKSNNSRRRKRV